MQVRHALGSVLETTLPADPDHAAFLEACADYMVTSMDRLDLTDMAILHLLQERVANELVEVHEDLTSLADRQARARDENKALKEALEEYRGAGHKNFPAFDTALRHYNHVIRSMMAPRKNPFSKHTDELFTMDDWTDIAQVTDYTIATEEAQFEEVANNLPKSLTLDDFFATHGMQRPDKK